MLVFQKSRTYTSEGQDINVDGLYINGFDDNDAEPEHAHLWIEQDPNYMGVNDYDAERIRVFINGDLINTEATDNFNELKNRPTIGGFDLTSSGIVAGSNIRITQRSDGKIVIAATGGGGADKHYTHEQTTPSSLWTIEHNLDKFPSVTCVKDYGGNELIADVYYINENELQIDFNGKLVSGYAFLN